MSIIEVTRMNCKNDSAQRLSAFLWGALHAHNACSSIRRIFELLNAPSHAVRYEAATTFTTLAQNPAASCFITLVIKGVR